MTELERLVLEKHQLALQVQQMSSMIIALCRKVVDDKGVVRLTKKELEDTAGLSVEVVPLKHGFKLVLRENQE